MAKGMAEALNRLDRIAALLPPTAPAASTPGAVGRHRLTRLLDKMLRLIRRYLRPLHWLWIAGGALGLALYARLVAATSRLQMRGALNWPVIPPGSVLTLWHGAAPSFLAVLAKQQPSPPLAIMIARDPRGDLLALLCRLLGLRVVRGDSQHAGWLALAQLAQEIVEGASVVITVDGGGPARQAKVGAVALAAATMAPLVPVGADCRPALVERHKWDQARNPVPFGRLALVIGEPLNDSVNAPASVNLTDIERMRTRLQTALNDVTRQAANQLQPRPQLA